MDKSKKAILIKEILNKILKDNRFTGEVKILKLKKYWLDIVGEELEKHITPIDIKKNILYINCDHQGWVNTLQFFKSDILDKIGQIFKEEIIIHDIKFLFTHKFNKP
jgi:hypothetical protein